MFPLLTRFSLATVLLLAGLHLAGGSCPAQTSSLTRIPPTSPSAAASTFRSNDGFRVELLASEPLVQDPVVLKYDEQGRAYVAEMFDYPYTDRKFDRAWSDQQSPPAGRIRILTDEDGDGIFDHSVVFVDHISWPTGIAFWKGGIYVAATPDLWYFRDTDGDLRADVRRKVFTGFRKYNVQAVMNNLQWGMDHYIYGAGGSNGGTITAPGRPDVKPVVLGRHDFRFDPREEVLEVLPGGARFGNSFDAWGERFICNIRNPLRHCLLPADAAVRGIRFPSVWSVVDAARAGDTLEVFRISPPEPWRIINARRLASARHQYAPRSEMNATGYVTSSSGVTVYRGAAYPREYQGDAFVAEAAGNLVMRYHLEQEGVSFRAEHVVSAKNQEFLASTDNWHRPVNFTNAPDGTLHLVDMYRQTIEHPWSIPDDLKAKLDLLRGRERGRIFRLVPPRFAATYRRPPAPRLQQASIPELVRLLKSPHGWWRETAQRLLWERDDPACIDRLRSMQTAATDPLAQAYALWTLEGLRALRPEDLAAASTSSEPRLRRHVVRLAARHVSVDRRYRPFITRAITDDDPRVRFEAVLGLRGGAGVDTAALLAEVADRDGRNALWQVAVVSAAQGRELEVLRVLLSHLEARPDADCSHVIGVLLDAVKTNKELRWPAIAALAEIARGVGADSKLNDRLWEWAAVLGASSSAVAPTPPEFALARRWLAEMSQQAPDVALDRSRSSSVRVAAVRLLGWDGESRSEEVLLECLQPDQPLDVQSAALAALMRRSGAPAAVVLENLQQWSPAMQREAVTHLLGRTEWTRQLLTEIREGRLRVESIPLRHRSRLRTSRDAQVRKLADAVLGDPVNSDRAAVIRRYADSLKMRGDVARGREVFRRECRGCHRFRGDGAPVGPDLDSVCHRSPLELLTHILDPDREVAPEFQRYTVRTKAGVLHSGIVGEEGPHAITLVDADNRRVVVPRAEIEAMRADPHSLMPNGLEEKISVGQMADLLAFLKQPGAG